MYTAQQRSASIPNASVVTRACSLCNYAPTKPPMPNFPFPEQPASILYTPLSTSSPLAQLRITNNTALPNSRPNSMRIRHFSTNTPTPVSRSTTITSISR